MKLINTFISAAVIVFMQLSLFPAWSADLEIDKNTTVTKRLKMKTAPQNDFKNLRTTHVPGIYCQQVDDNGRYSKQKHYFYNKKTEQLVEIPNLYYISTVNQLGNYKQEFEAYGAKSDTFMHKGKQYKIPTIQF